MKKKMDTKYVMRRTVLATLAGQALVLGYVGILLIPFMRG